MAFLFGAVQLVILLGAAALAIAVVWADPLSLIVAVLMVAAVSGLVYVPLRLRRRWSEYAKR
jgi:hypothetical protein